MALIDYLGEYGSGRAEKFLERSPESTDSFDLMKKFFERGPTFPQSTAPPSVFLTRENNFLLGFEDEIGRNREIEFTPTHIEFFAYEFYPEENIVGTTEEEMDKLIDMLELK